MLESNKIYQTDCLSGLKLLPDNSVDCCVTSPPYFNQRNYGTAEWIGGDEKCKHEQLPTLLNRNQNKNKKETVEGCVVYKDECSICGAIKKDKQIGLETTLQEYIDNLVEIFEEVKRVLKPTGQLWLNIGDTYSNFKSGKIIEQTISANKKVRAIDAEDAHHRNPELLKKQGFKNKDLMMVPARLAIALQESGWYLRNDIIWAKATSGMERNGSCMPESVKDRFVSAHEHIFLLTKNDRYFFDAHAVKEPINEDSILRSKRGFLTNKLTDINGNFENRSHEYIESGLANMRNVWRINLQPGSSGEHIAGYPEKLVEPCVKAGTSEYGCCKDCGKPYDRILEKTHDLNVSWAPGTRDYHKLEISKGRHGGTSSFLTDTVQQFKSSGWQKTCKCETDEIVPAIVLDPFMGSGTTAFTSLKLGRKFIGFELNENYIKFANERIRTMKSYSNNDVF